MYIGNTEKENNNQSDAAGNEIGYLQEVDEHKVDRMGNGNRVVGTRYEQHFLDYSFLYCSDF